MGVKSNIEYQLFAYRLLKTYCIPDICEFSNNTESPDIQCDELDIGIEVTSAYIKDQGKAEAELEKIKDKRKDDFSANYLEKNSRMRHQIVFLNDRPAVYINAGRLNLNDITYAIKKKIDILQKEHFKKYKSNRVFVYNKNELLYLSEEDIHSISQEITQYKCSKAYRFDII